MKKQKKNTHIEARRAIFLALAILYIGLFSISTALAWEFDNIKSYDKNTRTISIKNAFGLGEDLAKIQLKTPQTVYVIPGKDRKVAEFQITNFKNYNNVLKNIEFFDINNNMKEFEREFTYKYQVKETKEITEYKEICEDGKDNKTINCYYEKHKTNKTFYKWIELDKNINLIEGQLITIGVFVDVYRGDNIEWIPTMYGIKINEWAGWKDSFRTGLVAWYPLDNTSNVHTDTASLNLDLDDYGSYHSIAGANGNALNGSAGWITGSGSQFNIFRTQTNDRYSACVWVQKSGTGSQIIFGIDHNVENTNLGGSGGMVLGHLSGGTSWQGAIHDWSDAVGYTRTPSGWYFLCLMRNNTGLYLYENGNLLVNKTSISGSYGEDNAALVLGSASFKTSSYQWQGIIDEFAFWNRSLSADEINDLYNDGNALTYVPFTDPSPTVSLNIPADGSNLSSNSVTFNCSATDNKAVLNLSLYIDGALNSTIFNSTSNENLSLQTTQTLSSGSHEWTCSATDNENKTGWASSNYTFTIDATPPAINITYPENGSIITTDYTLSNNFTFSFNWTAEDIHLDSCMIWNGTGNNTVTCSDNTSLMNLTFGNYEFIFWANDTFGNENSVLSNFTWNYNMYEVAQIFNSSTYETKTETFYLNIVSPINILSINSILNYNGTEYTATTSCNNSNCTITKTIDIPLVAAGESQIKSFYYDITIFNGTSSNQINSSTKEQNVSVIHLELYNATYTSSSLNFTAWNEENMSSLAPFDFYGTFDFWLGSGNYKKNKSFSTTKDEVILSIKPHNYTYHTDATIQYEKDNFKKRTYYFVNKSITNNTEKIELMFLPESIAKAYIIEVIDETQMPVSNVYVYVQRYYSGEGIFRTVEIAKTDESGTTMAQFEDETEHYRIIIEDYETILYQSGIRKIVCKETPCTLIFQIEGEAGITWRDFGDLDNFIYSLTYNNATRTWTFNYTDTSGKIGYGRLYVYKKSPSSIETSICNISSDLDSAILTCDISGQNGTIYAAAYLSRSPEILVYLKTITISALKEIFSFEGLFFAFFILLVLGLGGLWNPVVGIALTIVGIVVINFIGLASFAPTMMWGVIIIGMILFWELKT